MVLSIEPFAQTPDGTSFGMVGMGVGMPPAPHDSKDPPDYVGDGKLIVMPPLARVPDSRTPRTPAATVCSVLAMEGGGGGGRCWCGATTRSASHAMAGSRVGLMSWTLQ